MSYDYATEKPKLFTEDGVETLTAVRDSARALLDKAGAFTTGRCIRNVSGDSWTMLAALDYLAEKGQIRRVPQAGRVAGQNEVWVAGAAWAS